MPNPPPYRVDSTEVASCEATDRRSDSLATEPSYGEPTAATVQDASASTQALGMAPPLAPSSTAEWIGQVVRAARLGWSWVPIRSLAARQRERIARHLLALDDRDRYLRFGSPTTDTQIRRYVDTLDFTRDEIFGIFNRRLELIAMAHLAYGSDGGGTDSLAQAAEFGVSVLHKARGRGYGTRLFDHAVLHARNRGVRHLHIHALSENAAMLQIARSAGARVERLGPESEAVLAVPPETVASRLEEVVNTRAADLDYEFKRHAAILSDVLDSVAEARERHRDVEPPAQQ
jgi:RimJ/RimL family protein N-acetyltransferase